MFQICPPFPPSPGYGWQSANATAGAVGNIVSLNRNGAGASTYTYSGNRLTSISGSSVSTITNYLYDNNGNATTDGRNNKTISYNILNLPATVSGGVSYTYDATRNKLTKTSGSATRHYIGGIEYLGTSIEFIHTEEGVARRSGSSYSYEYNLRDHLGNTRATVYRNPSSGNIEVLQRDDYYPFGLQKNTLSGPNNKYLYNGKELQDELGQYDYGARFYDPVIGRWVVADPLAENHYGITPYNYALNNPLRYTDPLGLDTLDANNVKLQDWKTFDTSKDVMAMSEVTVTATRTSEGVTWGNSKLALDIGGGIYGAMEGLTSSQGQWVGTNGKYYSNSWGGNQYTGGRSGAFKVANQYKLASKAALGVSAVIGAAETYNGYQMDGGRFGYNAQSAAAQTVGSVAGGWAGAEMGAAVGGAIGVWFGGVGAVPGAVIGGVAGGFVGGFYGSQKGGTFGKGAVNYYHGR